MKLQVSDLEEVVKFTTRKWNYLTVLLKQSFYKILLYTAI